MNNITDLNKKFNEEEEINNISENVKTNKVKQTGMKLSKKKDENRYY